MNRFNPSSGGFRRKSLVAGGLLAGALGLAMSQPQYTPGERQEESMEDTAHKPSKKDRAMLPPNVAPGWKIRVCSEKTKADSIRFRVSMADKQEGGGGGQQGAGPGQQTAMWTRGQPTLIPIPESLRNVDHIKVEAIPVQKERSATVCILFNDHVTTQMDFDDREVSTIRKNENGECGC